MTYCYTHRSMYYSTHLREDSSCSRLELSQRPIIGQCIENETLVHSGLHRMPLSNTSLQGSGTYTEKEAERLKVRGVNDSKETVLRDIRVLMNR